MYSKKYYFAFKCNTNKYSYGTDSNYQKTSIFPL